MKRTILATAALLMTTINYSAPVQAANPAHIKQLLQTKQCPKCDLIGADFRSDTGINLSGANLSGANLSGARLPKANLQGANLSNAILKDADLLVANLSKADLKGADLRASTLNFSNLSGADLSNADLRDATLKETVLSGANLNNANLNRVTLDDKQRRESSNFPQGGNKPSNQPWENAAIVRSLAENLKWEGVTSLAISPDGQILAVGSHSHSRAAGGGSSLTLWNLKTGEQISTLFQGAVQESWEQPNVAAQEPESRGVGLNGDLIYSVAFSPDGQTLAAGMSNKTIKLWNVKTRQEIRTFKGHTYAVHAVAISPNGQTLVSASSDKTIKIWNLKTGQLLRTIKAHAAPISAIAISPDGRTLASGSDDKKIKLWNLATGQLIRTFSDATEIQSVAFSPDGQMLATTRYSLGHSDSGVPKNNDPAVKLWSLKTGQKVRILKGNFYKDARSVAFSPDGLTLASFVMVNQNEGAQLVKLWSLTTGEEIRTIKASFPVIFSPDKQFLVTTSGFTIQVWH